jgi:hypothetical protein
MIKFSWHTFKEKDEYGRYVGNIVYGVGGIAPFRKCYDHYRPNMKCGHRHNHVRNATARMRKCKECGGPIVKGMEARIEIPLVRGRDDTMCRCCLRMLDEEIYHHNYLTVKEIEMMEADL